MNGLWDRKANEEQGECPGFQVSRKTMKKPEKDEASSEGPEKGVDDEAG